WGWPYYYYPGHYPYAYYPPSAPVTIIQQPAVAPAAPAQAQTGTWYYCDSTKSYYPYVQSCSTGWRQVPVTPPQ
ncbi:MAG: hypothetical protein ACHQF3_17710, partial [Alphaproteobacteria bacterium]